MNSRFVLLFALVFSLPMAYGASHRFTGTNHAVAVLLLSDSDQSIKLAAKSLYRIGSDDPRLLDVLGEVIWNACSDKRQLSSDTLAWLVKAIGKTKRSRFASLLDYCLSKDNDEKPVGHLQLAKKDLTTESTDTFEGGRLDITRIRAI